LNIDYLIFHDTKQQKEIKTNKSGWLYTGKYVHICSTVLDLQITGMKGR